MTAYYKVVGPAGEPLNGGSGIWPLPVDGQPGAWREVDGDIRPCYNGLHLTTAEHLQTWLPRSGQAFVVYRAEVDGEVVDAGEKVAARRVRLLPRAANRPAPDVAELERRRTAAYARADRAYTRSTTAAPVIPEHWRSYLAAIWTDRLPAGHPGAPYAAAMGVWRKAQQAAGDVRMAAHARAQRVYHASLTAHLLPD